MATKIISFNLLIILCFFSCKNESYYLSKAIKNDAIVCPLISAGDSAVIMINISSNSILNELRNSFNVEDPVNYLSESINNELAICVSNNFYMEHSYLQVHPNAAIDSIYCKQGINGLIKNFFKDDMGMYILWNSEQLYFLNGSSPYPAFGDIHNVGYIAYILSKHNIFLSYLYLDEDTISLIIINEKISDMKQLCLKKL